MLSVGLAALYLGMDVLGHSLMLGWLQGQLAISGGLLRCSQQEGEVYFRLPLLRLPSGHYSNATIDGSKCDKSPTLALLPRFCPPFMIVILSPASNPCVVSVVFCVRQKIL